MKEVRIFDFLLDKKHSKAVAYEFGNKTFSFNEIYNLTIKTANILLSKGIKPKDNIALLFDNSPEFILSVLASDFLCLRIIPINTKLSKEQTLQILEELKPKFLLTNLSIQLTSTYTELIHLDLETIREGYLKQVDIKKCSPDEPFLISTTSGSTSKPKPIVLSTSTKIKRAFETVIDLYKVKDEDVLIVSTPMYHTLGFRLSLIPIYSGCKAVIIEKFEPQDWLYTVSIKKVSLSILVSSQIRSILPYIRKGEYDLSSLRCLVSSSSSLSGVEKEEILNLLSCDFHEMYGTSETSTVSDINLREFRAKIESVGYPLKNVEVAIIDEQGNRLKPKEVGEIAVRTPLIFSGYLNMEQETKRAFLGDYFLTGDLGYMDEDGFLYYKGRKKFLYKVGAINVFPEDVESVILSYNGIKECAVVGVQEGGETKLIAFYSAEDEIRESELRKFCFQKLASYQVPYRFIQLEELPKNHVGKIDRRALEVYLLGVSKND